MRVMRDRRASRLVELMSLPSIVMDPPLGMMKRRRAREREDLPHPEGPTMPIFSPCAMEKDRSCKTSGPSCEYLAEKPSNWPVGSRESARQPRAYFPRKLTSICPCGQFAGGLPFSESGSSCAISE